MAADDNICRGTFVGYAGVCETGESHGDAEQGSLEPKIIDGKLFQ